MGLCLGPDDPWCWQTRSAGPEVNNNSSATVMLGLEGTAVLAVSDRAGELEYAIETTAATGLSAVRSAGQAARSPADVGS